MRYDGIKTRCDITLRMGEIAIYHVSFRKGVPYPARRFSLLEPTLIGKAMQELASLSQRPHFTGANLDRAPGEFEGLVDSQVKEIFGAPKSESLSRVSAGMMVLSDGNECYFSVANPQGADDSDYFWPAVILSSRPPFHNDRHSNETDRLLIPEWQDPEILGHAVLTLFGRARAPFIAGVASVLCPPEPKRRTDLHEGALSDWREPLLGLERSRRARRRIDPVDTAGATPLMLAAASGYPRFAERLLALGADHSLPDNNGRSALHHAAGSARNETIGVLLGAGADIHCADDIGDTPLHLAAARGHESTVRLLLESGADPNTADSAFSSTPLHKAVRGDHTNLVPTLVAAGADVDSPNEHDRTPLHVAVSYAHVDSARALIEAGADVDRADRRGRSPLHTATFYQHLGCLTLLIEFDAEVGARDREGNSALHIAASMNRDRAAALLLDSGADIEAVNHEGLTALDMAIVNSHSLEAVLPSHTRVELTNNQDMAFRGHNSEAAWALLERGASLDPLRIPVGDRHALWPHLTPRELMFDGGDIEHRLPGPQDWYYDSGDIDYRKLPDLPDSYKERLPEYGGAWGFTPYYCKGWDEKIVYYPTASVVTRSSSLLHDAVLKRMPELVEALLKSGVDPMTAVRSGFEQAATPLHIALVLGDYHTAQTLLDHGADIDRPANNYTEVRYDLARGHDFTPLNMALMKLHDPEMARFLLSRGATPDLYDRYPVDDTEEKDRLVSLLLDKRCPPERREAMTEVLTEFGIIA